MPSHTARQESSADADKRAAIDSQQASPDDWKAELREAAAGLLTCALLALVLFAASAPSAPMLIGVR